MLTDAVRHGSGRVAGVAFLVATALLARQRYLRWGATDEEVRASLPGDGLIDNSHLMATRAVAIRADPAEVWPWLTQLGQGRGGFYSYDRVENLVGCHIHSADRILPQFQAVEVGDEVRLHPDVPLAVAQVQPGHALVLRGGVPMGPAAAPYDFTWAFVLRPGSGGTTRLVVRERYGYAPWWSALLVGPVEAVSAAMSRRMLNGIRDRVEAAARPPRERLPHPTSLPFPRRSCESDPLHVVFGTGHVGRARSIGPRHVDTKARPATGVPGHPSSRSTGHRVDREPTRLRCPPS